MLLTVNKSNNYNSLTEFSPASSNSSLHSFPHQKDHLLSYQQGDRPSDGSLQRIKKIFSTLFRKIFCCFKIPSPRTQSNRVEQSPSPAPLRTSAYLSAPVVQEIQALTESLRVGRIHRVEQINVADRQRGGVFGQAVGDALGFLSEFTTREEAQGMIRQRPLEYSLYDTPEFQRGPRNEWRHQFPSYSWTDDTDQAICTLRAVIAKRDGDSRSLEVIFAEKLRNWSTNGLEGREDAGRYRVDIGGTIGIVLRHQDFLTDPHHAARSVWEATRRNGAANGAVMRTAFIGMAHRNDLFAALEATVQIAKATHADPRCIASCAAVTTAIFLLLQGCDSAEQITLHSQNMALTILRKELAAVGHSDLFEQYANECRTYMNASHWDDLNLDTLIGYTFKCLGAAFYTLRLAATFARAETNSNAASPLRRALELLISQGGDADTNGAVAGALLGCYFGTAQNSFPASWIDPLHNRSVLEQIVGQITTTRA